MAAAEVAGHECPPTRHAAGSMLVGAGGRAEKGLNPGQRAGRRAGDAHGQHAARVGN